MSATIGSVDVRLGADLRTLSAQLTKGEKRVGQYASKTDKQLSRVAASFVSSGKAAASFLAPLKGALLASTIGGFLSLGGAIAGAKDSLAEFDKIAKSAKVAGFDSDAYQSLAYSADLAGVSIDKLDAGLQAFRRNSSLAASEQGTLYTVLKKVNPELLRQIQVSDSQAEKIRIVADAMKAAKTETERVALATAAFGRNGQALIPILTDGAAGLDEMQRKAQDLGIIVDRELLRRSEDLTDQLSTATKVMDLQFKSALVSLAPVLVSTANLAADVAKAIGSIADRMRDLDNRTAAGLDKRMTELGLERLTVENEILALKDKQANISGVLAQAERRLLDGEIAQRQARLDAIAAEEKKILEIQKGRNPTVALPPVEIGGNVPSGSKSRDAAAKAALREAQAVQDVIAALQREQSLLHATDAERRIAEELRRAGSAATADQREQIIGLVQAITAEEAALRKSNLAMEARRQSVEFLLSSTIDSLEGIVSGADSAADAFKKLALSIADAALQAALFGSGPFAGLGGGGILSGIFGSITGSAFPAAPTFGGLFHDGGDVGMSTGNHREVLTLLEKGETVFDQQDTARIRTTLDSATREAGKGGSTGDVTNISIDARGAAEGVEKKIVAALEEYDRKKAPKTVLKTMRSAQREGVV